ncbi:MAG: hypothetical protein ACHQYP_03675 [Nitrospiria bacterium]
MEKQHLNGLVMSDPAAEFSEGSQMPISPFRMIVDGQKTDWRYWSQ